MASVDIARYPVTIDGETSYVGTAAELAITLDVLQGRHDRAVLEQLSPHLAEVIGGPTGFISTLKSLAPDDQIFLIEALRGHLAGLIRTGGHLRNLLALLSEARVEERLLAVLGASGLRRLITSASDLAGALEWVYGECDQEVLDLMGKENIGRLITSGHDLSLVLNALDVERQGWLLEQLGAEKVHSLAANVRDLAHLMRVLPGHLSDPLLSKFTRPEMVSLVGSAHNWEYLCRHLESGELATLCELMGVGNDA